MPQTKDRKGVREVFVAATDPGENQIVRKLAASGIDLKVRNRPTGLSAKLTNDFWRGKRKALNGTGRVPLADGTVARSK